MNVNREGDVIIITQEETSVKALVHHIKETYNKYKDYHLIFNLLSLDKMPLKNSSELIALSNTHRDNKKSFVIVVSQIEADQIHDAIVVAPTQQEAFDIIEMENIERDLGF